MKTPAEIKKGLECCHIDDEDSCDCGHCPYAKNGYDTLTCDVKMAKDILSLIEQLEKQNNVLYHTLLGVMHFVDKWLEDGGYDPGSDANGKIAVERAAKAREIALRAIEEAEKRSPL